MTVLYDHPVSCAVAFIVVMYGVAFAALGWPFRGDR